MMTRPEIDRALKQVTDLAVFGDHLLDSGHVLSEVLDEIRRRADNDEQYAAAIRRMRRIN